MLLLINIDFDIKDISCGIEHSLLLSNNGDVYTVGDGKYYKLGHGNEDSTVVFQHIFNLYIMLET